MGRRIKVTSCPNLLAHTWKERLCLKVKTLLRPPTPQKKKTSKLRRRGSDYHDPTFSSGFKFSKQNWQIWKPRQLSMTTNHVVFYQMFTAAVTNLAPWSLFVSTKSSFLLSHYAPLTLGITSPAAHHLWAWLSTATAWAQCQTWGLPWTQEYQDSGQQQRWWLHLQDCKAALENLLQAEKLAATSSSFK